MVHDLPEEVEALRQSVRALLGREATDQDVHQWDSAGSFPEELYKKIAGIGVCGLTIDPRFGGSGPDYLALCMAVEEIARASGALAWIYLTSVSVAARSITLHGTDQQRERLLPLIASGDLRVAVALTEPEAGSDLGNVRTAARRSGSSFVLTGQKVFTTGAMIAGRMLTLARTDTSRRFRGGLTFFLVDTADPRVNLRPLPKMAGQAVHTCEVYLDDVEVHLDDVLGPVGGAGDILFSALSAERVATAAMALGIAKGAFDKALAYAQGRQQFGRPIIQHQAVAHLLADMAIDVEVGQQLTYRAAVVLQQGGSAVRESAIAKVAVSEIGTRCANRGMQILGGYSYMTEYGMERYWRESKLYEIAAGTNQILRDSIVSTFLPQPADR